MIQLGGLQSPVYILPSVCILKRIEERLELSIERSGCVSRPETLCCVLGQDTLLSQCLSPRSCMGAGEFDAGGNPAMD